MEHSLGNCLRSTCIAVNFLWFRHKKTIHFNQSPFQFKGWQLIFELAIIYCYCTCYSQEEGSQCKYQGRNNIFSLAATKLVGRTLNFSLDEKEDINFDTASVWFLWTNCLRCALWDRGNLFLKVNHQLGYQCYGKIKGNGLVKGRVWPLVKSALKSPIVSMCPVLEVWL